MTIRDFVFLILRTPKTSLHKCLESPVSEDPSRTKTVNGSKDCLNLHHSTFIILIDKFQGIWVGKNISYWHRKSLDCLLNTLDADEMYPFPNRDKLKIPIQMQLSQKQKNFFSIFFCFFKIFIKFWIFWKKRWPS